VVEVAAERPPVDAAEAGLTVAVDNGADIVLALDGAPPEDLVGVVEHAEQPLRSRRQLDLLLRRLYLRLRHWHQSPVADPAEAAVTGMRHRRRRLFEVNLAPRQISRFPVHLGDAALGVLWGTEILGIRLVGQAGEQLGPNPGVARVLIQTDMEPIPARRL